MVKFTWSWSWSCWVVSDSSTIFALGWTTSLRALGGTTRCRWFWKNLWFSYENEGQLSFLLVTYLNIFQSLNASCSLDVKTKTKNQLTDNPDSWGSFYNFLFHFVFITCGGIKGCVGGRMGAIMGLKWSLIFELARLGCFGLGLKIWSRFSGGGCVGVIIGLKWSLIFW